MPVIVYTPSSEKIVHETRVDFRQSLVQPVIHIVQYDKSMPIIAVKLYSNHVAYVIPEQVEVNIRWGKPDNTFVYNSVLGCNEDRTMVYFEITEQMTLFYGENEPIIELIDGTSLTGSGYMYFNINRNPIQHSDVESQIESNKMYSTTTTNRPLYSSGKYIGVTLFDITIGKPIWWNGNNWVDSLGTVV